jgi:hypothetical protein
MASKPAFKYRGARRTVEEVNRRAKRSGAGYDSYIDAAVPMYKPKEGECCIRLMPPTWTEDKWGDYWNIDVWVHYGVGAKGGTYLCLDKMKNERCPVCEAASEAADKDEARQFQPTLRAFCWVIDRNEEKLGPQVWSMPNSMFKEINSRMTDKKTGEVLIIDGREDEDNSEGYDVIFTREGSKLNTDYTGVEISRDPTSLHDDDRIAARWMKYIRERPLPDLLQFYDADYIDKVLMGRAEPKEDEGEATEQEDTASSRRRSVGRKPVEEAEEAEPPRSRTSRGRAAVEEPEEEPEEPRERTRRPAKRDAEDNDEEAEATQSNSRRSRRPAEANGDDDPPFDDDADGTEKVSATARRSLERMKERRARR